MITETEKIKTSQSNALELLRFVKLQEPKLFAAEFYSVQFSHQRNCAVMHKDGFTVTPEASQQIADGCNCQVSVRVTNSVGRTGFFVKGE